jgi:hypothetical protein
MRKTLLGILFLALCPLLSAQQGLSNDAIIRMVKAGLSDDVIVTTINASQGTYDTSPDALIALKQAGVSDKVIAAVVARGGPAQMPPIPPPPPPPPPPPLPPGVDQIGAYYKDMGGSWLPLPTEVVVFESAGVVKHFASATLVKEDLDGVIGGMRSRLVLSTPITFIVHVPDGRTINDYQLMRLHVVSTNRQFLYTAGGLEKETTGALRDVVDFTGKQIGPSAWQIVIGSDIGEGEFGFLEPQDTSKTAPTSGRIFTFAVVR